MKNFRLRTKFLLSFVAISAGMTAATLFLVRYSVQERVQEGIREDLRTSVKTFQVFDRQRDALLTQSAQLLANLPNVRALMTTNDRPTIQDASEEIFRQSGSDVLMLTDRQGRLLGMQTTTPGFGQAMAEQLLQRSLAKTESRDWWFGAGHLFEVRIQPIYFGAPSRESITGFLVVGDDIDELTAREFGAIVSSDVAFYNGETLVASTLNASQQADLERSLRKMGREQAGAGQIQMGNERYVADTIVLPGGTGPQVTLTILKSLDQATAFVTALNGVLLGLGLLSIAVGSVLVFLISHTFTKPLANLVAGVRALEGGDFGYPLEKHGDDEVAEVTATFDRMRGSLQKTLHEQKTLEDRLRQAHKMEAVGRLAGGVAHDFNNLLTIIRGHGDILLDRINAADKNRHSIEQIQKAADRAVSMTRQLLAFSRMQVLQPRILDLNAIVADMGKMLPAIDRRAHRIRFCAGRPAGQCHGRSRPNRASHPESGRQCPRCHAPGRQDHCAYVERHSRRRRSFRASPHDRGPLCLAVSQRYGPRHERRNQNAHLRTIFHHQGGRQRHWSRACDGIRRRQAKRRIHLGGKRVRARSHFRNLSAPDPGEGERLRLRIQAAADSAR